MSPVPGAQSTRERVERDEDKEALGFFFSSGQVMSFQLLQLSLGWAGPRGKAQGVGSGWTVLGKPSPKGAAPGAAARWRQAAPGSATLGWGLGVLVIPWDARPRLPRGWWAPEHPRGVSLPSGVPKMVPICLRGSSVVPAWGLPPRRTHRGRSAPSSFLSGWGGRDRGPQAACSPRSCR